jgi:two-component sensor histidine kinase
VLVASLDVVWLTGELLQRGLSPDGSVTIADRQGIVIARQPLPERFIGTKIPESYMRLVHAEAAGTETVVSQDGTLRVLGYVPVSLAPKGLYVSVGLSAEASYGAVRRAAASGALIAVCAGLATLAASWWAGSQVFVKPIQTVIDVMQAWRRGERTARTGFRDDAGEIAVLGATLDLMMDEIEASQDQRDLLASELSHRIKNTLATVQAIAASTLNKPTPAAALLPEFTGRIAALARTHEVLTRDRWEGADLRDIVMRVVQPLCGDADDRLSIDGPAVECPARQALGMTMVLHELCTNALKYGALSVPHGRVDVTWSTQAVPQGTAVTLVWRERNGPPVVRPTGRGGFGSRLMARAFGSDGTAAVEFGTSGVTCRVDLVIGVPDAQGHFLERAT